MLKLNTHTRFQLPRSGFRVSDFLKLDACVVLTERAVAAANLTPNRQVNSVLLSSVCVLFRCDSQV
jgi:hypothetical protein